MSADLAGANVRGPLKLATAPKRVPPAIDRTPLGRA
jgi:hypothetical protein